MAFAIDDLSPIAHWSVDAITGLSDGDPVDSLPESISSWDIAFSGTARPLYRSTSSINSLPAIEFDGSNDFGITATSKSFDAVNLVSIIVARLDSLKNYQHLGALDTSSGTPPNGADYQSFIYSNGNSISRFGVFPYCTFSSVWSATTNSVQVDGGGISGFKMRVNGKSGAANGAGTPAKNAGGNLYASLGNSLLAGSAFDGLFAEWVLIDETELCESLWVEGFLAHKYGITLLDVDHPFYSAAPTSAPGSAGGTPTTFHPLKSRALGA